ncbi:cytochrome P450 [Nonomuraea muscovyensis]|uniref:cytochrome P450 n=1 Tax=Nonomuraea muscovyensis TaxID=1124761 RepID=UPI0033C49294|nr:Cytochrome [Nonomuraea muscovyensis]
MEAFNPFDPVVNENPYPFYAWLREHDPAHYSDVLDAFVLSRHADVAAAFRDVESYSSAPRGGTPDGVRFLLGSDPPEHTALRKILNRRFTPGAIRVLEPEIEQIVAELTDELMAAREGGVADYVAHVAYPLPVIVIARLMGIPAERRADFKRWADAMVGGVGLDPAGAARAFVEMRAYFLEIVAERRVRPGEDLISRLVTGSEPLSPDELWGFCTLLLIGGTETTTNLIGNGLAALLADPALQRALREHPSLAEAYVEESLRYDAPVQAVWRITRREAEAAGTLIPADSRVLLLQGSANRDPGLHDEPDAFVLRRAAREHLGFGVGIHFCLGAPLARMEARIAVMTLLAVTEHLEQAGPARRICPVTEAEEAARREGRVRRRAQAARPRVRRNPVVRGLRSLPVALTPR